jgi:DNA polymerase-4
MDAARVRGGSAGDGEFLVRKVLEPDAVDRRLLESFVYVLAEELGGKLRTERSLARELRLELRYADEVVSHGQMRPAAPTSDDTVLFDSAGMLFDRIYGRRVRVRAVSLAALSTEPEPLQLDLFPGPEQIAAMKARRVQSALDRLRDAMPSRVAPSFGRALAARRAAS